jgi:DNA-binding XRE family transcriptional regulator
MTQKPKNQKTLSLAARNLKLIRAVLGLTQSEWAEQIGSNSKTVGAYEQGTQKPQLEHLQADGCLFRGAVRAVAIRRPLRNCQIVVT